MHSIHNFTGGIKTRNRFALLVKNLKILVDDNASHRSGKARFLFNDVIRTFRRDCGLHKCCRTAKVLIFAKLDEFVVAGNGLLKRAAVDAGCGSGFSEG